VIIEDVTQRERQADALGRQHRRDQLLSWALAHLLKTEHPRKAIRQLFFKIAEQLDYDTFLVYLRDPDSGLVVLDAAGGIPPSFEPEFRRCPFLQMLADDTPEIRLFNSVQSLDQAEFTVFKKAGIAAVVVIPLYAKVRNLGVLCFATCIRDTIEEDESELLTTIAQYFATALDRENTNLQLHKAKTQLSEHAQLLEQRVQERTARLQETVSELETFSYTIAHDLRAPARGMTGYCDVMLEDFSDSLPADARLVVQKIARASRRMEMLTHDLLEFSKISRQEIVLSCVEIEPIIEDITTLRAPVVRQAITLRAPLYRVRAHRGLLQHVFSNLVDNAIKFVHPGTAPRITISTELVPASSPNTRSASLTFSSTEPAQDLINSASPDKKPAHVRIWVQDEGIGIPREAHKKIFGIFERGLATEVYEGTGIGLAIVARAMQRMGGTCGVESEPGTGSRFWLELPAS
jgi:signal transduction histidine kinase